MVAILTESEIDAFIYSQVIGRIGCYADGKVYVTPITYAYDGEFIYGYTREGKKIKMMRKNPQVCFEIDLMFNMFDWKSVIIEGVYEELTLENRGEALESLTNRIMPFLQIDTRHPKIYAKDTIAYRIKIIKKTGRAGKK